MDKTLEDQETQLKLSSFVNAKIQVCTFIALASEDLSPSYAASAQWSHCNMVSNSPLQ